MKEGEGEKIIEETLNMKYICNFPKDAYDKYQKALVESRAIGIIVGDAYDRKGNPSPTENALYFKDRVEESRFLRVLNCIYNNEQYEYHDLSQVGVQELMDELTIRMYRKVR